MRFLDRFQREITPLTQGYNTPMVLAVGGDWAPSPTAEQIETPNYMLWQLMWQNVAISAWQEVKEVNTKPQVFVPASGVRYRPLKRKSGIEGQFVIKKWRKEGSNYACMFVKVTKGSKSYSSWGKCKCAYWLISSPCSETAWGEFSGDCSSCCFGCKKMPWL